jgi:hypothetical protein
MIIQEYTLAMDLSRGKIKEILTAPETVGTG